MTLISATEPAGSANNGPAGLLGEITRRASHEVKNALNAVVVNVEVVRMRMARTDPDLAGIRSFAESASSASERAASLGIGLADLSRMIVKGTAAGKFGSSPGLPGTQIVTIQLQSADGIEISRELAALAASTGVSIRVDGATVIFTVRD